MVSASLSDSLGEVKDEVKDEEHEAVKDGWHKAVKRLVMVPICLWTAFSSLFHVHFLSLFICSCLFCLCSFILDLCLPCTCSYLHLQNRRAPTIFVCTLNLCCYFTLFPQFPSLMLFPMPFKDLFPSFSLRNKWRNPYPILAIAAAVFVLFLFFSSARLSSPATARTPRGRGLWKANFHHFHDLSLVHSWVIDDSGQSALYHCLYWSANCLLPFTILSLIGSQTKPII